MSRELFLQLSPPRRDGSRVLDSVPLKGITRTVDLLELPWRVS